MRAGWPQSLHKTSRSSLTPRRSGPGQMPNQFLSKIGVIDGDKVHRVFFLSPIFGLIVFTPCKRKSDAKQ